MLETLGPSQEITIILQHLYTTFFFFFPPEIKYSDRSKLTFTQVTPRTKTRMSFFLQSDQPLEQNKHASIDLHVGKHLKKEIQTTLPLSETSSFHSLNLCLTMEVFFLTMDLFPLGDNLLIPLLFNEKAKFCFHLLAAEPRWPAAKRDTPSHAASLALHLPCSYLEKTCFFPRLFWVFALQGSIRLQ